MNEIDENIDFDNFLFLECDMTYYYKKIINKYFYNRLGKHLHDYICDEFEFEYHNINLSFNIK
jgi:hypothetical protein